MVVLVALLLFVVEMVQLNKRIGMQIVLKLKCETTNETPTHNILDNWLTPNPW